MCKIRYLDKVFNYFLSPYLNSNNIRNYNSTLLKLFFERNNKYNNVFSSLGNVFRNSKWSDLQVQNIKTSMVNNSTYFYGVLPR